MYIKTSIKGELIQADSIYLSTTKIEDKSDTVYSFIETPTGEIKLIKTGNQDSQSNPNQTTQSKSTNIC